MKRPTFEDLDNTKGIRNFYKKYLNNKCHGYFTNKDDRKEEQYHNNSCKNKPKLYWWADEDDEFIVYSLCDSCKKLHFVKQYLTEFSEKEIFYLKI